MGWPESRSLRMSLSAFCWAEVREKGSFGYLEHGLSSLELSKFMRD